MKEIIATITSKGQVTIPAEVRKTLGLSKGDKVAFVIQSEGSISLEVPTYPSIASLAGAAGSLPAPLSWEKMRDIGREDHLRAKRYDSQ